MKDTGERAQDKLDGGEIAIQSPWKSKWDNFWFYHKWHVLIGAFVVLVVLVCVLQMRENEKDDITLLFAGPYKLSATEAASLRTGLNDILPEDYNEDGKKYTEMVFMQIFSEQQEALIRATPEGEIPPYLGYIDSYYNDEQITAFDNLIMAGEYSVCILDPWLYERVKGAGGFRKLTDVLGATPQGALDEYGVLLAETDFAKLNPVCALFPEGTVVCLRTKSVMNAMTGKKRADREYAEAEAMFRALVADYADAPTAK